MNKFEYFLLILSIPISLAMLAGADAATVQQDLNVTVVPSGSTGQCVYGKHGLVRGRPHIAGGTLLAEDGCILRGFHGSYNIDNIRNTTWVNQLTSIAHMNTMRIYANAGTDSIANIEAGFDAWLDVANQTGIYLIFQDSCDQGGAQSPCPESEPPDFWTQISSRYANKTNVIYEIMNEPDVSIDPFQQISGSMELNAYNAIRQNAPDTMVIVWSPSYITADLPLSNIKSEPGISYTNAVIGWHGYDFNGSTCQQQYNLAQSYVAAGYGQIMTETNEDGSGTACSFTPLIVNVLEPNKTSWMLLNDGGFCIASNHTCYGNTPPNPQYMNITWPQD